MSKDWTDNSSSIYMALGASNHTNKEREINDYYATDPIAIDALIEGGAILNEPLYECSCGEGHLSERLKQHGYKVISSDLIDRGYGKGNVDFLKLNKKIKGDIITNPPYKYAEEFIRKAMELLEDNNNAYFLLKLQFLEGKRRGELFKEFPFKTLFVSRSRILCAKNGEFEKMKASGGSAVAYGWFHFQKGFYGDPIIKWIN